VAVFYPFVHPMPYAYEDEEHAWTDFNFKKGERNLFKTQSGHDSDQAYKYMIGDGETPS
jgi:hypothetical protein